MEQQGVAVHWDSIMLPENYDYISYKINKGKFNDNLLINVEENRLK
jgi:hypothetical protein